MPHFLLGKFPALLKHRAARFQPDSHGRIPPLLTRSGRCRLTVCPETPLADWFHAGTTDPGLFGTLAHFGRSQRSVIHADLVHRAAEMVTVAAIVLPPAKRQAITSRHAPAADLCRTSRLAVDVQPQSVPVITHRQVVPRLGLQSRATLSIGEELVVTTSADIHHGTWPPAEQHNAVVSFGLLVMILTHQPRVGAFRHLAVRGNKGPQFERESLRVQLRAVRNLQVVGAIQAEPATGTSEACLAHRDGHQIGPSGEHQAQTIRPGHRFETRLDIQPTTVFRREHQIGHIRPLHESPRLDQTRPTVIRPLAARRATIDLAVGRDRQREVGSGQCLPDTIVRPRACGVIEPRRHRTKMRNP